MVSRHGKPDCIVLLKLFMRLHEVENPLLELVKHGDLHCMEQVSLMEVAHNTGNMAKHVESSENIARREFAIGCLGVGIAELSM